MSTAPAASPEASERSIGFVPAARSLRTGDLLGQ